MGKGVTSGKRLAAVGLACAAALIAPASALAVDHNIRIREVFAGATTGQGQSRFVELQMASGGQNLVAGNVVRIYDATGTQLSAHTFPANLAVGTNQSSILVATTQGASFFGVTPDLSIGTANIPRAGGMVCYDDTDLDSGNPPAIRDCVTWGNFTGSVMAPPSPAGNPFSPAGGLPDGRSILRDISGLNPSATNLEIADDTNDSAADFDPVVFPNSAFGPKNNAAATMTTKGTASIVSGQLVFDPAAGVKNRLTVADSGSFWRLTDTNAPLEAGPGCEQVFVNRVRCPKTNVTAGVAINGEDQNDRLTGVDGLSVTLDGGAGDDILTAKNGTDTLVGGTGRDVLDGGFGPDTLDGGDQQDTVTYDRRTAAQPVVVDIDGVVGDDGGAEDDDGLGTRDTVAANVENLKGGAGGDMLAGSDGANTITGKAGQDQLLGLGGSDTIQAKDGSLGDTIQCGAGVGDRAFADGNDDLSAADCETVS